MSIIKNILLGSVGALFCPNTDLKAENVIFNDKIFDCDISNTFTKNNDLSLKLRLELNSAGEWSMDSHRSHRSHSSHRSHYSSSTGNSNTTTTNNSNLSSGTDNTGSSTSGSTTKVKTYTLGDRILYKGMKGNDVTQIVNILIKKKYLQLNDGTTIATGVYEYDDLIFNAIKKFQTDNAIEADGVVNSTTLYLLKK